MVRKFLLGGLVGLLSAAALAQSGTQPADKAQVQDDERAVFLVATPRLVDPSYRQTVLLVVPVDNDRHVGFIINRPTTRSLSSLFPEHEPSKQVSDPVYFGGPMSRSALFAVVRGADNPGGGSIRLMKNLFMSMKVDVVDRIIEKQPNSARYYVGYVEWRPGELRHELDRGLWYVTYPDQETVFRKDTGSLWEELIRLARSVSARLDDSLEPSRRNIN